MERFQISESDRIRLTKIIRNISHLTEVKQRRVKVVSQLLEGKSLSQIARQVGLKPPAIAAVSAELKKSGIAVFLDAWEGHIQKSQSQRSRTTQRGRPGMNTVQSWIDQENCADSPIMELATVMVAPGALVAALAFNAASRVPLSHLLNHHLRETEHVVPTWTQLSLVDTRIDDMLKCLQFVAERYRGFDINRKLPKEVSKLADDYDSAYKFVILYHGPVGYYLARKMRLPNSKGEQPDVVFSKRLPSPKHFFRLLESVIFELRSRWSCPGLLPTLPLAYEDAAGWVENGDWQKTAFVQRVNRDDAAKALRHNSIMQHYCAHFGGLALMNPRLWSKIPWQETFPLVTLPFRPRISVVRAGKSDAERVITLHAMPEVGHLLTTSTETLTDKELEKSIRETLRQTGTTIAFKYSNRDRSSSLWSQVIPIISGHTEEISGADTAMPTVLMVRHTVMPESELPLEERIRLLSMHQGEGVFEGSTNIDGATQRYFLFNCPILLEGIESAFRAQWYGDAIHLSYRRQSEFAPYFSSQDKDGLPFKTMGLVQFSGDHPTYWDMDQVLAEPPTDENKKRLAQLEERIGSILECFEGETEPPLRFAKTANGSFRDVLRDLDADFLLLGLPSAARSSVDRAVDAWCSLIRPVLVESYNPRSDTGRSRVIAAIPESIRRQALKNWDDVSSWVHDSIERFVAKCRRIDRAAVETAQQLFLARYEVRTFAIETEQSLLARWHVYLQKRLRGEFLSFVASRAKRTGSQEKSAHAWDVDLDDESPDAHDLVELIKALICRPSEIALACEFVEAAVEEKMETWRLALAEVHSFENGEEVCSILLEALQLCREKVSRLGGNPDKVASRLKAFMVQKFSPTDESKRLPGE